MNKFYKGKKVLVTAGPTWVALDRVRVLTSIFSGQTGLEIARKFADLGADVILLMGPGRARFTKEDWQKMKIEQFFYYDELFSLVIENLQKNNFDIIVHSSAVSDYRSKKIEDKKIPSKKELLRLDLVPTKKIVDFIREKAPKSYLIKFKLEVDLGESIIEKAYQSLKDTNADLIVANDLNGMLEDEHIAYLIDKNRNMNKVQTKDQICSQIAEKVFEDIKK